MIVRWLFAQLWLVLVVVTSNVAALVQRRGGGAGGCRLGWQARRLAAVKKGTSPSPTPSPPAAPRVQKAPGSISVRQQIAWARAYRRLNAAAVASSSARPTRKFRQEKGPKEVEEEYVEIDYVNTLPPVVFVDGYNVIGFINVWEQRNTMALDDARDCLISDLCVLKGGTGWHIELVFDAYKHAAPEKRETVDGVFVTFTRQSETADDCIERRFNELSRAGHTNMIVVTDDQLLRGTAEQLGAGFLTCGQLLEEMRIAYRGWELAEEDMTRVAKAARPTIGDGVSAELKEAISTLKAAKRKKDKFVDLDADLVREMLSQSTESKTDKVTTTATKAKATTPPKKREKDKYINASDFGSLEDIKKLFNNKA